MRSAYAWLLVVAACSRAAHAEIPTRTDRAGKHAVGHHTVVAADHHATKATQRRFHPTAFSVEVHGHGRPVILIPGLGCPGSVWRDTVHHLRGYETHTLTLAGFAGKPRIDQPLARTTVEQLARYIRDRHLGSPVIIGHSLGGFIAYWLAVREPRLVGPTIIVDSGAGATGDPDERAGAAAQARQQWSQASDREFDQRVQEMFSQMSVKPGRLDDVIAEVARSDRRAIGDVAYELSVTSVRDDLDRIRAPVLLVLPAGSSSDYRRQVAAVRDHEIVAIPNAGHFVMLDAPQAFHAAIDDFLAKHERLAAKRSPPRRS